MHDDDDDNDYYGSQNGMRRLMTACANWNPQEEQCYCMGDVGGYYDYCVQTADNWGVAVPRGTAFPGGCDDGYDHGCPAGMEPIIPRSREHWARSVFLL